MLLVGIELHDALLVAMRMQGNQKAIQYRIFSTERHGLDGRMAEIDLQHFQTERIAQMAHIFGVKESYRQAEAVYNVTEEQYKEGISSMTALLQDEMQLRAAQAACVQAHCQCNLARLDLLRLAGQLAQLSR